MKKVYSILTLSVLLCNCYNGNSNSFKIVNNSDYLLTNLIISNGKDTITLDSLLSQEHKKIELLFSKLPKHDGGYSINFLRCKNDTIIKDYKNFGYYSNGMPSGSIYRITIENDTILISESFE